VARGVDLHPLFSFGALWRLWKMRECTRLAAMTDMLSLLTAYGVPLPQAVVLAGDASGDNRLKTASHDLAQRLARGEPVSAAVGFPPLLAWVLGAGSAATDLAAALRRMGDTYRDEAQRQGQWLTLFVPLVMTVLIGGTAVALVATVYFGPFVLVLYQLIEATSQVN
jgi:type II secretory pathway component PulF